MSEENKNLEQDKLPEVETDTAPLIADGGDDAPKKSEENKNQRPEKLPDIDIYTNRPKKTVSSDETGNAGFEAVKEKSKFTKWIENFFYHYKWHTAAVAFILIVAIVCTVTMCGRKKADVQIIYAGNEYLSPEQQESLRAELGMIRNDGTQLSFSAYWWMSDNEIKEAKDKYNNDDSPKNDFTQNQVETINDNKKIFDEYMMLGPTSSYFIWFMSPALYEEYKKFAFDEYDDLNILFEDLGYLKGSNPGMRFYDSSNTAICLSSLVAYSNTGLNALPDDTVIVFRAYTGLLKNNRTSKKAYDKSKDFLKDLVEY